MHSFFSENEEFSAPREDDEIFFGPVGHTEKCVAVAVDEVVQESDRLRPLSPLSAAQMAELCREAFTVAYQIAHADSSQLLCLCAGSSSNGEQSGVNPVEDLTSNVDEINKGPCFKKTLSSPTGDVTLSSSASRGKWCGHDTDKTLSNNSFESLLLSPGSAVPVVEDLTFYAAEADGGGPSSDEVLSSSTAGDVTTGITELGGELCGQDTDKTLSSNSFEGLLSSPGSAMPVVEGLMLYAAEADRGPSLDEQLSGGTAEADDLTAGITDVGELCGRDTEKTLLNNSLECLLSSIGSAAPVVEGLTLYAAEAHRSPSLDDQLSSSTADDVTVGNTESRRSSCGKDNDKTFEGLLSSLGSALPVIEPGSLMHDEHGVVKFTAAAAAATDSANAADANTKCRTGIPTSSGLRRAFSAKASATRASGIPLKGLAVRHVTVGYICLHILH